MRFASAWADGANANGKHRKQKIAKNKIEDSQDNKVGGYANAADKAA